MEATIYKSTGSWYSVKTAAGEFINARIKGVLKIEGITSTNPVAVGDRVEIEKETTEEAGAMITAVIDRKNYINRQSPANKHQHHIIASNLDQSVLIATLKDPKTSQGFIDRFLVAGEAYHIPSIIVFNKTDLYRAKETETLAERTAMYEAAGYTVLGVSIKENTGLDALRETLRGKTTLVSGHSGVGKSSFINHIVPGMDLKTKRREQLERQRHAHHYVRGNVRSAGSVCPSDRHAGHPRIRAGGYFKTGTFALFPRDAGPAGRLSVQQLSAYQRAGCAIKKALGEGILSADRYISYCVMLEGVEQKQY